MAGTVLEKAPLVRVSARNGTGIEELKLELGKVLSGNPARLRTWASTVAQSTGFLPLLVSAPWLPAPFWMAL